MTAARSADGAPAPGEGPSREEPPPLDEDPGRGQFYFPGRPKGCLSGVIVMAALALAACVAGAAGR